jgi:hypothetical protein
LLWVLQFLPEVESDMSVFHRVEDITTMRADVFVRRAQCLMAYGGAVRQEARRQALEQAKGSQDTGQVVSGAQAIDEEALWAAHRQQAYSKFLNPGEVPREVGLAEGIALASQVLAVS